MPRPFESNPAHEISRTKVRVALFVYWTYVLIVTFHPFELSPDFALSLSQVASAFETLATDGWNWLGPIDFFLNIVFFLPCGVLFYALWKTPRRSKGATLALVTMAGGLASILIEAGQVFALRNSSAIDVVSNALGSAIGAFAYSRYSSRDFQLLDVLAVKFLHSKIALCCAVAFALLPLAYSFEQSSAPFWRWDSRLTLQLGNEPTWNRPWLGKIYLAALYRRALSAGEIKTNFAGGFSADAAARRVGKDLVALYTFNEGGGDIVRDSSNFEPALDLKMSRNGGVRWLADSNGVEFARRSIVKSRGPATKLVEAVRATDELSVEVWMKPRHTAQNGPGRIISLSGNSRSRNFTLGQEGADIHFRLRTPVSGSNGAPVLLRTDHGTLTAGIFHVVATYRDGIERLYINGVERPEKLNLATDGIVGFATRKTPVAQLAHSFVYFFPLSFFLSMFFSTRSGYAAKKWPAPVAIIAGLAVITEVFQASMLARAIDFTAIGCGILIGIMGVLSVVLFAAGEPPGRISLKDSVDHSSDTPGRALRT